MKPKLFYTILMAIAFSKSGFCQEITNVLAKRITEGGVEIKYDLTSANKNDSIFYVELHLFQDDKLLYKINDATGNIGFRVKQGISNKIFWNPFTKKADLIIENARFKITATSRNKDEMILIVGGNKIDSTNKLAYEVKSFYTDNTEVKFIDFKEFVQKTNYKTDAEKDDNAFVLKDDIFTKYNGINWHYNDQLKYINSEKFDNMPVIFISYNDASKYCEWKNKRLPTDIEWDVMASNCFENPILNLPNENAWFSENSSKSYHSVNSLKPNNTGIFHLFGNVSEWCNFDLSSHLKSTQNNQNIASVRGGSFITSESDMNNKYRTSSEKFNSFQDVGFRCVSTIIE